MPDVTMENLEKAMDNLGELLDALGSMQVSAVQSHIAEQKDGDGKSFSARYGGKGDPFISIAGALADFNAGKKVPKANRFQPRPVLQDTGDLLKGVTHKTEGQTAVVGLTPKVREYGSDQAEGNRVSQPVTAAAKKSIAAWLTTDAGAKYSGRMGFLLNSDSLDTNLHARNFMSMGKQEVKDQVSLTESFFVAGGDINAAVALALSA